ncbi:MAG: M48 family metallopeptidase [Bacteroidetes bacterium]|nr:M48 family metallopeptidase [Bacteroidota bacterium]
MKWAFFLLLIVVKIGFAQNTNEFHRSYIDSLPKKFYLDHVPLREHIFSQFPEELKFSKKADNCFKFANEHAIDISYFLASGQIYTDWNNFENYLNSILEKILPAELKGKNMLHVYISKAGDFNSYSSPTGVIFFNVGTMPFLRNEAGIAGILAHEVAHYYLKHSINYYLNFLNHKYDGWFFQDRNAFSKNSIESELAADSIGMVWMSDAGYSVEGLLHVNDILSRLEKNYLKNSPVEIKISETTHPSSEKRKEIITHFIQNNSNKLGSNFILNDSLFQQFKNESKLEVLDDYLSQNNFASCIQNAFIYHIFDPENGSYYYYLLEGIRRYCYFDKKKWNQNFITDCYYDTIFEKGKTTKIHIAASLFDNFDIDILPIDPNDGMKIKAKYYWRESPAFTTYNEAFTHFYNLSLKGNNPECILSNALSYANDTSKRNVLLDKYLSFSTINHRTFATAMRKDSLYTSLRQMNLHVISSFSVGALQGTNRINLGNVSNDKSGIIYRTIRNSFRIDSINNTMILDDLKSNNLNEFRNLKRMELFSRSYKLFINSDIDIILVDPTFWELFKKYDVTTINFNFYRYTTALPKENTLEGIQKIVNCNHSYMWYDSKYMKYLSVLVSSITLENMHMKQAISVSEEAKIDIKESTEQQLVKLLNTKKGMHLHSLRKSNLFW